MLVSMVLERKNRCIGIGGPCYRNPVICGNYRCWSREEPVPESVTTSEIRRELQFCNAQQMGKKRDLECHAGAA